MNEIKIVQAGQLSYGMEVIGGRDSHWRFRTPDGQKHRSQRATVDYLNLQREKKQVALLLKLGARWHCKVESA